MTASIANSKLALDELAFLDRCAALELKVASLYHHFEELFTDNLPLSLLWRKTAREEENHSLQFGLGGRLKGTGMKKLKGEVAQASEYLQKAEKFIEKCLSANPSEEDALSLAIKLEEHLADLHMSSIVVFEDAELKKMFDAMMKSDRGHITMLLDYKAKANSSRV